MATAECDGGSGPLMSWDTVRQARKRASIPRAVPVELTEVFTHGFTFFFFFLQCNTIIIVERSQHDNKRQDEKKSFTIIKRSL